jgi:hypothetical protein
MPLEEGEHSKGQVSIYGLGGSAKDRVIEPFTVGRGNVDRFVQHAWFVSAAVEILYRRR